MSTKSVEQTFRLFADFLRSDLAQQGIKYHYTCGLCPESSEVVDLVQPVKTKNPHMQSENRNKVKQNEEQGHGVDLATATTIWTRITPMNLLRQNHNGCRCNQSLPFFNA